MDFAALLSQIGPVCGVSDISADELEDEDMDGVTTVQDVLAPNECDLTHKGYILIDGVFHTYLYIAGYGYPTEMGPAWLSPLVELGDGISLSFFLDRKRKEQVLPKIAKTTMLNRTRMRDIEDTRADYEELDDAISSGLYIKDTLNREGEDFW